MDNNDDETSTSPDAAQSEAPETEPVSVAATTTVTTTMAPAKIPSTSSVSGEVGSSSSATASAASAETSINGAADATATATAAVKQAQDMSLLWTWVNPGQQHLCVADVTPLCTSAQLPAHLGTIFSQLASTRPSKLDILFGLVYAVALECGFCSEAAAVAETLAGGVPPPSVTWWFSFDAPFVRQYAASMPADCYDYESNFYTCALRLHGLSTVRCTLIVRDVSGMMFASLVTADGRLAGNVVLPVGEYVVHQQLQLGAKCVKNLDTLTQRLRDRLFGPVRNGLLDAEELPYAGVLGVPDIVRRNMYVQMGLRDLQSWSSVCRLARAEVCDLPRVRRVLEH